ncbi:MAG: bifunctional phosphopantothenoylcysteine decarboxylase/phosphopantothenate--cysteine ligase CoaBC [Mariprofundaceae bacterium]
MFAGKRILIGIGGGIAVYRVAELARLLIKQGAQVRCVMTSSACEFVTHLTFEALTGEKVFTDLFDLTSGREMGHIQLARWADVVLIAPATANLLARFAHGIADDLLTTMIQVCEASVLLAPAMNTSMWESDATQRNVRTLQDRGMSVIGPEAGELACGEQGAGRLSEPLDILDALKPLLCEQSLLGQRWVINAGPTVESWDAVRVLTNRATGLLGMLLANQAVVMGADVTLIAGPGTPQGHKLVKRIDVQTAQEMLMACEDESQGVDVFVGTAAVSDFRFVKSMSTKLKRGDTSEMQVNLIANPDIIASMAAMDDRPKKIIAFAAETSNHVEYAKEKLVKKGVDAIVANDVSNMGADVVSGSWVTGKVEKTIKKSSKEEFSRKIINHIMEINT